jgi:hypothetical protein
VGSINEYYPNPATSSAQLVRRWVRRKTPGENKVKKAKIQVGIPNKNIESQVPCVSSSSMFRVRQMVAAETGWLTGMPLNQARELKEKEEKKWITRSPAHADVTSPQPWLQLNLTSTHVTQLNFPSRMVPEYYRLINRFATVSAAISLLAVSFSFLSLLPKKLGKTY